MFEEVDRNLHNRRRLLGIAAITIAAAQCGVIGSARTRAGKTTPADLRVIKLQQKTPAATRLPIEGKLPSLHGATTWLNSQPLTAAGLRGKVVLIDFLDILLHQLAAPTSVCPRMGREIQGSRIGGDRGTRA